MYSFSPKMSVCPTIKAAEGSSVNTLPVLVEVQVSVGKIKIDTRERLRAGERAHAYHSIL